MQRPMLRSSGCGGRQNLVDLVTLMGTFNPGGAEALKFAVV